MDEHLKIPSSTCETPESKPVILENTEYLATSSTSFSENIPIMSLESMPNRESKGVEQKELNLPSTSDNIQSDAEPISQFVEELFTAQKECKVNLAKIKEKRDLFSAYLDSPLSSAPDLVHKLKSLTASEKFIKAEKQSNNLLSSIEEELKSIRNKFNLSSPANSVLRSALTYLKKAIKKFVPKQEGRKTEIAQIKESLAQEFTLPPSTDEEIVNEFHSLKHSVECIAAEQTKQYMLLGNILESLRFIKRQLPPERFNVQKPEISEHVDKNT